MADVSTFPTLVDGILHNDGPTYTFTAGEALTAGQVVGFASGGTSDTVVAMDATVGETPIGVVLYDTGSGAECAVALMGSVCTLVNADDTTAIDAGDSVIENNNALKGTVSPAQGTGGIPAAGDLWVIGVALEDIAGGASGPVLINPYHVPA
jgi:hypothetical protein